MLALGLDAIPLSPSCARFPRFSLAGFRPCSLGRPACGLFGRGRRDPRHAPLLCLGVIRPEPFAKHLATLNPRVALASPSIVTVSSLECGVNSCGICTYKNDGAKPRTMSTCQISGLKVLQNEQIQKKRGSIWVLANVNSPTVNRTHARLSAKRPKERT